MSILKGILSESKEHYLDVKDKIGKRLDCLPVGSVKGRKIAGRKYYYLQYRKGKNVIHKYLGSKQPVGILKQIHERKRLKIELKKVEDALKLLRRAQGKERA